MEVEIAQASTQNNSYENVLRWFEEQRWQHAKQDGSDMEVEIDMEQPVNLGFDESDEEDDEEEQIPSEDCSCTGRPVTDSNLESGEDTDMESAYIVESVLDRILDHVMYMAVKEDSKETNDTLMDSGPWEDNNDKEEAMSVEAVQQEAGQQKAVKKLGLRRSDRLKMKLKRL